MKEEKIEIVFDNGVPLIKVKTPLEIMIEKNEKELKEYKFYKKIDYISIGFIYGMLFTFFLSFIIGLMIL